jgi:urease accessory protein
VGVNQPMNADATLALTRLLRLASPALPVGAYSYSQGLETAVERGWVSDEASIGAWVADVLAFNLARFEGPVLCRLHAAWKREELEAVAHWNQRFLAGRETAELRAETCQMGYSLRALFESTGEFAEARMARLREIESPAFPAVFAFAAAEWQIEPGDMLAGYLFSWAENQVSAAMKTMRIGHVAAQRILAHVALRLPGLAAQAQRVDDEAFSNFTPALAIASCMHETQDSRMFRS